MFIDIENVLIILLEIFCCVNFYEVFLHKRHQGKSLTGIGILILWLLFDCIIIALLSQHLILKLLLIALGIGFAMYGYFKVSIKKSMFLAILYQSILLCVDYFTFALICTLFPLQGNLGEVDKTIGTLIIILEKMVVFLVILLLKRKFGEKTEKTLADMEWIRFIVLPVFTIAAIVAMISLFRYVEEQRQANILMIVAFVLVGINMEVFYLIRDIMEKEAKLQESRVLKLNIENQTNMYRSISENFEKQKKKAHEYRNQISYMEALLQKKEYGQLETFFQKITGSLKKEVDAIDTNNIIVNAILNTKYQEARDKKIVFAIRVNDLSGLRIAEEDIVAILSNLLNNAIEACEKCLEQRVIKLKFVLEEGNIILSVKNTYEGQLNVEGDKLKTTKLNEEEHGVGIDNIIDIIHKYDGSYVIKNEEDEFNFSLMIPNDEI